MAGYQQAKRVASIETEPLGTDTLLLRRMVGVDRVSQPFNYFVETLCSPGTTIDYSQLVGHKVTIKLKVPNDGEKWRYFNGYVVDARFSGPTGFGFDAYHLMVVPWFWLLKKSSNCRIFRDKTVEEVLTAVFKTLEVAIAEYKFDRASELKTAKIEHFVQYNETDFAFASRIMEENGIYYYFEHDDKGGQKMILIDSKAKHEENPEAKTLDFTHAEIASVGDQIFRWGHRHQVISDAFDQRDYNFATSTIDSKEKITILESDTSKARGADPQGQFSAQVFTNYYYEAEFEEGVSKIQSQSNVDLKKGLTEAAELKAGACLSEQDTVFAESYCRELCAGYDFTFQGHPESKQNGKYFITSVRHHLEVGGYGTASPQVQNNYACSITAIPEEKQFYPKKITPRLKIYGPQTATVVAEQKSDKGKIYTDSHGRVKVRFHWDREKDRKAVDTASTKSDTVNTYTKNLSCWIRVSRNTAGKQWGTFFMPRVGQEVIVEFLNGDPDRPLITGSVNNAKMLPPYLLPDFGDMSTIKTKSLDKAEGKEMTDKTAFNEIRFYDRRTSEQIFINAARAMDIQVKGNYREKVGGNIHLVVSDPKSKKEYSDDDKTGYRFVSVNNDDYLSTIKDLQQKVGGSYILKTGSSLTVDTEANLVLTAGVINVSTLGMINISATGGVNISSPAGVNLKSGASSINVLPASIGIKGLFVSMNGAMGVPPVIAPSLIPGVTKPEVQEAAKNTDEIDDKSGKIKEKKIKLGKIS